MKASANVFPVLQFAEGSAAATPPTATVVAYAKADGKLYSKDDAGVETPLSGGGGGGGTTWGSITGTLLSQIDLMSALDAKVESVVAGTNVVVDNTDPKNPIISAVTGGGSTGNLVAGTNVTLTGTLSGRLLGAGNVTINATGGGGGGTGTVTSVGATGSTGLTVGGSPVTTSGTLTFTLSSNLQNWSSLSPTTFEATLRNIPTNIRNGSYTLQASDFGRTVEKTGTLAAAYTLGTGGAAGDVITILNSGTSGDITITRSGSTLYQNGVNADITVQPGNMVTILRTSVAGRWQA